MTGRLGGERGQRSSESGSILILTALSMTVLLGIAALALDVSFMYDKRNRLHAAADAGAMSAAIELQRNPSISLPVLQTFANQQVTSHGFNPAGTTIVTVANCGSSGHAPCTGAFIGNNSYVEVTVSEPTSTFFAKVLGSIWASMTPGARAVAGISASDACVLALAPSGTGILVSSNAQLDAPNCSVMANSNSASAISASSNARIDATGGSVGTTGACSTSSNGTIAPGCQTSVPPANDPLAGLPALTPSSCSNVSVPPNGSLTINQGTYCSISVAANATLTMNPGRYIMNTPGGLSVSSNGRLSGSGVLIYNASGTVSFSSNAQVNLTAETTGTYAGILIYQPPTNTADFSVSSNGSFRMSGALYFPSADVTLSSNGFASTDCFLLVARTLSFSSNATYAPENTCSAYGGSPIHSTSLAE